MKNEEIAKSLSISEDKLDKLKALFPEVFTEGKIDFARLKKTLGDIVEEENEHYELSWARKSDVFREIQKQTTATLKPARDESIDFDKTGNIFIEGENLEVLKILQKSYYGKIKMIYIDPPYNTGNDQFVYPDKFSEKKEEYEKRAGLRDEEGNLNKLDIFKKNSRDSGHYHSNWLSMMYPRLFLAKNLLRDDGVIFISIDDNEVHNLRLMMNEIFGEENFVSNIVWKKKTGAGSSIRNVFDEHEYVLCYAKKHDCLHQWRYLSDEDGTFKNPDNDSRGPWESCAITAPSKNKNPNQLYAMQVFFNSPLVKPETFDRQGRKLIRYFSYESKTIALRECIENEVSNVEQNEDDNSITFIRRWSYTKDSIENIFIQRRVYINGSNIPRFKKFQSEYEGKALRSIYYNEFSTQDGSSALSSLFSPDPVPFEYPKPPDLIGHFVNAVCSADEIVMDFFSGSAPTAHAVLELNKEDGGNRKFICVQLPEKCDENSEAFKAGYETIADIGKERIRRVIKKIKEEQESKPELFQNDNELDLGFKVFKLSPSNFKSWRGDISDEELIEEIEMFVDPVKEESERENILFELLLKAGITLTTDIEVIKVGEANIYSVDNNRLILALESMSKEIVEEVINRKPQVFFALDRLFEEDDELLANTSLQLKELDIDFKVL